MLKLSYLSGVLRPEALRLPPCAVFVDGYFVPHYTPPREPKYKGIGDIRILSLIMDDIVATLAQMTLDLSNIPSSGSSTLDNVEHAFNQLTISDAELTTSQHDFVSPPSGDIQRLICLDEKLDAHMKSILVSLDALAHPDPSTQQTVKLDLLREQSNMRASLQEMRGLNNHPRVEIRTLAEAMRERLEQFSAAVDLYVKILHERAPPPINPRVIQTGMNNHYNLRYLTKVTP